MAEAICDVHTLVVEDHDKRVVRIRSAAFQTFQGKRFMVRITSTQGKSACFEAVYADEAYMERWRKKYPDLEDTNLVFMRETWRDLLEVDLLVRVNLEEIPANDSFYEARSALSDDRNEGRIYIFNEELHDQIAGKRYIARIKRIKREDAKKRNNGEDAKTVYCEVLYADDWYLEDWREKWEQRGTSSSTEEDQEKNGKHKDTSPTDFCKLIFISAWYRNLLGIETIREKIPLDVKVLNAKPGSLGARIWEWAWELWALLYLYPRNHPQAAVRTANMMGFIALGLGIIGTGLGFLGIMLWLATIIICSVGFVVALFGIIGLSIRR